MATTITTPSVVKYEQDIQDVGYASMIISSMKALADNQEFRTKLLALHALSLTSTPDLQVSLTALTLALANMQLSISSIENGIRSNLTYPV